MSGSGIRELSLEERALVSGGAQGDTTDLPPVDVTPPEDSWPDPGVPSDPGWDNGGGDSGGGDSGGGGGDSGGSTTFTSSATVDGNGVASATQTWSLPDYNLTFNLTENLNLTNGDWGLAGNGSFQYAGQTYTLGLTTDHFSISDYHASYTKDFGNGVSFNVGLTYDPNSHSYTGQASLVIGGF